MVLSIVNLVFNAFQLLLFVRIIFSWIRISPYDRTWGPIQRFVFDLTEPILAPIRRLMPQTGMFDFSVLIAFILLSFLQRLVIQLLYGLSF